MPVEVIFCALADMDHPVAKWVPVPVKVEYNANENPLTNSEKFAYVGQRLMYPIIKKENLIMLDFVLNAIKVLSFYIKNSSF